MSFFKKREETTITLYSYEVVEDSTVSPTTAESDPDASTTSGPHCAWCGDPPDKNGSHGICLRHAAEIAAKSAERRRSRGRA